VDMRTFKYHPHEFHTLSSRNEFTSSITTKETIAHRNTLINTLHALSLSFLIKIRGSYAYIRLDIREDTSVHREIDQWLQMLHVHQDLISQSASPKVVREEVLAEEAV
jgi:hypothetical protein